MSNVVKLSGLPKKQPIDKWQELIDEQSESLLDRLYDQIKLADVDALEEDMPEKYSDCMIVGVIASLLVTITYTRNVCRRMRCLSSSSMRSKGDEQNDPRAADRSQQQVTGAVRRL